jgi:hypothetical protein
MKPLLVFKCIHYLEGNESAQKHIREYFDEYQVEFIGYEVEVFNDKTIVINLGMKTLMEFMHEFHALQRDIKIKKIAYEQLGLL